MGQRHWQNLLWQIRRLVYQPEADAPTDRRLLERFVGRQDEDAFSLLVERHGPMVLGVCRRVLQDATDAEDAFQATFCVLARRAGGLAWQESVANWLYAVAQRVALKAKARAARQRQLEQEAAVMRPSSQQRAEPSDDLRGVLDAEVLRLPAKYRAPIILCYLEGQTNEAAAQQIGCPKGTLQARLARGRALLRKRLVRRGLTLAVAPLAADGFEGTLAAAVPEALRRCAVQTAIQFGAGGASAGSIPANIATLAEGGLSTMWLTKGKIMTIVVLSLGILVGLGAAAQRLWLPGQTGAANAALTVSATPEGTAAAPVVTLAGGIVDPAGKAVYVMNTDGGIDALELKTGQLLWKTPKGATYLPLAVVDQRLVVRTPDKGGIRIVVLDSAEKGKILLRSELLSFPNWVAPYRDQWFENRFGGGSGMFRHDFAARERIDKGDLVVEWHGSYRKGTEKTEGAGSFRIDLKTGQVKATFPDEKVKQAEITAQVGRVKAEVGTFELIIDGTTDNRKLKVKDKESGRQLWEHPLKSYTVTLVPR